MNIKKIKIEFLALLLIIAFGAFLRFYKLDWGEGLFTHPDEYHIVTSVNQLSFPFQMHPNFFNYGTVTIYLIYFTKEILNFFYTSFSATGYFPPVFNLFIIGRFYSAFFSTFTIFFVYKIAQSFLGLKYALLASFLTAITPGLIQQAHFATPESALIFFLFASLLSALLFSQQKRLRYLFFASILFGLALGVKISGLPLLTVLLVTIFITFWKKPLRMVGAMIGVFLTTALTFATVAPFVWLDFSSFRSSLTYESGLAMGTIPVFYTRQFIDTQPILFQLEKIFPYALGLPILIAGIGGFLLCLLRLVNVHLRGVQLYASKVHFILIVAFLSLFIPNAFLFAKWTRFIAPTFPFFPLFATSFIFFITKINKLTGKILVVTLITLTLSWSAAFFSIYLRPDVRIVASDWLVSHTPVQSSFLVEGGNMADIPLLGDFQRISLDFYNLENNPLARRQIAETLARTDYFIIQSRRVFKNHLRLPNQFPKTASFYRALFNGDLGFTQIKEFSSYPALQVASWELEIPDEDAEETWSVFDHPVIRVFQKKREFTKGEYAKFLEN